MSMRLKFGSLLFFTAALVVFFASSSEASIINLNAAVNDISDPVSVFLNPGLYYITPVTSSQFADANHAYDAWNPWSNHTAGCDANGANCTKGWENSYAFSAADILPTVVWDGVLYQYTAFASAHGIRTLLQVTTPELVNFFIVDSPISDNGGGTSLNVSAVPEPATLLLLSAGAAVVGRRKLAALSRRRAVAC